MPQTDTYWTGAPPESLSLTRLLYEKKGFTARITINRADVLNCFDLTTLQELGRVFQDASNDDTIAVVVITGAGDRAFCTGADLREQEDHILKKPNDYYKWMYAFIEMHDRLRNIGKPTIARLNGMVVGGGNELNMACDLAVAADHVTIRQVGAARGSVAAGGATQWLPLIIGDRRAREMLLLCEPIDAYTALDWGLVNQVVPAALLDQTVDELAERVRMIGQDPPAGLAEMLSLASVGPASAEASVREMIEEANRHALIVIAEFREAAKIADEHDDPGTVDLCSKFVQVHEKQEWWLRDILRHGDGLTETKSHRHGKP